MLSRRWTGLLLVIWLLAPRPAAGGGPATKGLTDAMLRFGYPGFEHSFGLWYDRRRDAHDQVRRPDRNARPPFLEQPWARSGTGHAWAALMGGASLLVGQLPYPDKADPATYMSPAACRDLRPTYDAVRRYWSTALPRMHRTTNWSSQPHRSGVRPSRTQPT